MNEYRSLFYELEYINDILKEANAEFEFYKNKFCSKKQVNVEQLNQGNWGQLFDIADQHGLDLEDYDSINNSLKGEIFIIRKQINNKKTTYAWLLYHCESDEQKDKLIKQFLNHIYVDYRNST